MPIGAHVSIAGGIWNAPERAAAIGCECFQLFTRSPQGGPAPPITDEIIAKFRAACEEHGQRMWVVHTPYYINLASKEERTRQASARVIRDELDRASLIGAKYVMTHLGSAKDVGEAWGITYAAQGLRKALDGYAGSAQFLIEISAGAGAVIGATFEEVAAILEAVDRDDVGICFDTQHAFGSGYDLRTPDAVAETMQKFDATIGLSRLKMSHVNDSKVKLGEHKDRHEHIGHGHIGTDGIRAFVQHSMLDNLPLILETEDGPERAEDVRLLKAYSLS